LPIVLLAMFGLSSLVLAISILPAIRAATIAVTVGNGGLKFDPPFVNASIGDVVNFTFFPKVSTTGHVTS
jgi:plastocyanin